MVNEGLIGSIYSLPDLSLPFTCSLTTIITKTCIIKVNASKGMISKLLPPLRGLIGLVMPTSCTIDGVARTLLLVLISRNTKLRGSYLKSRKVVQYACNLVNTQSLILYSDLNLN